MESIFSSDPSQLNYFILPVLILIVIFTLLLCLNFILSKSRREKSRRRLDSEQIFLSLPLIEQQKTKNFRLEKKRKERALKFRYLSVFLLTRSSTWAKSPFMYTLFSKYHGMNISEIGVLYVIDAFSSLIFGPLTGNWADKYGRKLFCICYCVCIVLSMCLRAIRFVPFVYVAQIITGFGAGLIFTTYESWINFEAEKHLRHSKQRFLEKLFQSQNLLDTITSLIVGAISAMLYSRYGILAPIFLSIAFAALSVVFMLVYWDENRTNSNSDEGLDNTIDIYLGNQSDGENQSKLMQTISLLKDREIFSMGKVESFVMASLGIMIFSWTPWLQSSTNMEFNIGYFYVCMILGRIIGATLYEFVVITLKVNHYLSMCSLLAFQAFCFLAIYMFESLFLRIMLVCFLEVGFCFYSPLNSSIKSMVLPEKSRALIMNIFRIPLNCYVIIMLFSVRYIDPFTLALICFTMISISTIIMLSMYLHPSRNLKISGDYLHISHADSFNEL